MKGNFGRSDEAFHKIASRSNKPQRAAARPAGKKAIPLGDDEGLDQFNN